MSYGRELDLKAFLPIGITFIGFGVVFVTAVNSGAGAAFIVMGICFVAIGAKKSKKP